MALEKLLSAGESQKMVEIDMLCINSHTFKNSIF